MQLIHAIVLGIVQGLTEFIPISSSAHLVLIRHLFGWEDSGLLFDVMLHLGTLVAALVYFRKDLWNLATKIFLKDPKYREEKKKHQRLLFNLVIASIPGALAGFFFEDVLAEISRSDVWIGATLIVMALIFFVVEYGHGKRSYEGRDIFGLSFLEAFWIGVAQMTALLPGISRSGATISAGLFLRMNRAEATRFSFLMSMPIIAGAGLNGLREYMAGKGGDIAGAEVVWGFLFSALFGYLSIAFLIRYLKTHSLKVFGVYILALGVLILVLSWL